MNLALQNSYQSLPFIFFAAQNPKQSDNPDCVLYNAELVKELKIGNLFPAKNAHNLLSGHTPPRVSEIFTQSLFFLTKT